jgi:leucyl aminopeptidase (aminopeptidase T)
MKNTRASLERFASLFMAAAFVAAAAVGTARADTSTDQKAAAKNVVQIAGVSENQIVVITSDPANYPFLEDLAVQTRALGAFPLLWISSDNLNERMYSEVAAKYDSQVPLLYAQLIKILNVQINVDYGGDQNYDFFAAADQNRLAAQNKAGAATTKSFFDSNRRYVEVGNGLFPSAANASLYGVSQDALAGVFWKGMGADYSSVQAHAAAVKAAIAGAGTGTMHVTNPNGTDFTFGVKGVKTVVSAGSIPADCSGLGCYTALPAGEVIFIPVQGTGQGKVVFDNATYGKDVLKNFTMTFQGGKMTSMTSSSDLTKLKAAYATGGEGRDEFTFVDLGVNDQIQDIQGSAMAVSPAGGSTTFGIGGDTVLGGSNDSPFGFAATQAGSTVTLDGKTIVQTGKLQI